MKGHHLKRMDAAVTADLPEIEIFAAGTHRAENGQVVTVDIAELQEIADNFRDGEGPVVIGHPKTDDPAWGWCQSLRVTPAGKLCATLKDVHPDFIGAVRDGRYRNISVSLTSSRPRRLRHIGFLGAVPPAVKGLAPVTFADDGDALTFADAPAWSTGFGLERIARLLRGVREFIIQNSGQAAADAAMPSADIDGLLQTATEIENTPDPGPAAVAPANFSAPKEVNLTNPSPEALEAQAAEVARREAAVAVREKALTEAAAINFADSLVSSGRLPVSAKGDAVNLLVGLSCGADVVNFADGGDLPPADALKKLLGKLAPAVPLGEHDKGEAPAAAVNFAAPAGYTIDAGRGEIHAKALAHAEAHNVDYLTAVRAVEKGGV